MNVPAPLSVDPTDDRLTDSRWFYVWNIGALGECCCPRGSYHNTSSAAIGRTTDCGSCGKHPYVSRHDGFPHGSADALPYQDLIEQYGSPKPYQRLAMTLADVVMLDIDSPAALRAFFRIRRHVPPDKVLGIAKTPRGWHIYLHCPEWTQKAVTLAMKRWLGDGIWDGQDQAKVSWRGMVLDVRTGSRRYTIWPGQNARDRHWATMTQFSAALGAAGRGMPKTLMVHDGDLAPWNLTMNDELREAIARAGADTVARPSLVLDGSEEDMAVAWYELERWARMLEQMMPESGRNNRLNQTAYYAGADAIAAGHPEAKVRERLLAAASKSNTPGAEATINSGLTSGWRDRYADA